MANTVNASITITRDGVAKAVPLKGISYGKLVTIEAALAAAQMNMVVWGVGKMAGLPGFAATKGPWASDIGFVLEADFDGGGSAKFAAEWHGLSVEDADEVQAALDAALADPLK